MMRLVLDCGGTCRGIWFLRRTGAGAFFALQSGKQCKPVQVCPFFSTSLRSVLPKWTCWGKHPQSPLNSTCGAGCAIFQIASMFGRWNVTGPADKTAGKQQIKSLNFPTCLCLPPPRSFGPVRTPTPMSAQHSACLW